MVYRPFLVYNRKQMDDYSTIPHILSEARFFFYANEEVPTGEINGTNKTFRLKEAPFSKDYLGVVDADAEGFIVDTLSGNVFTLTEAPTKPIETNYRWTNTDLAEDRRAEAVDELKTRLATVSNAPEGIQSVYKAFVRLKAAGLIMISEYALQDTTDQSINGYRKMETADKMLDKYIKNLQSVRGEVTSTRPIIVDKPNPLE